MASSNPFFERPILYSPYEYPTRHWELDDDGQPTQRIIENRRRAEFVTPIPKPKKRRGFADQQLEPRFGLTLLACHDEQRLHFEIGVERTQALLVIIFVDVDRFLGAGHHFNRYVVIAPVL